MKTATLTSQPSTDDGTFGTFATDDGTFMCATGELPDRNNQPGISRIDADTYLCTWLWSNKHGRFCYHLEDKHGRGVVEIHAANWMGDASLGKKCQLEGCIAPGLHVQNMPWDDVSGVAHNQMGVASSGAALTGLEAWGNKEPFNLTINRN